MDPPKPWTHIVVSSARLKENGNWEAIQLADPRTGAVILPARCASLEAAREAQRLAEAQDPNIDTRIYCASRRAFLREGSPDEGPREAASPLDHQTILGGYAAAHPELRWTALVPLGLTSLGAHNGNRPVRPPQELTGFIAARSAAAAARALKEEGIAAARRSGGQRGGDDTWPLGYIRDGAMIHAIDGSGVYGRYASAAAAEEVVAELAAMGELVLAGDRCPCYQVAPSGTPVWGQASYAGVVTELRARALAARGPAYAPADPTASRLEGVEYTRLGRAIHVLYPERALATTIHTPLIHGLAFRAVFASSTDAENTLALLRKPPPRAAPIIAAPAAPARAPAAGTVGHRLGGRR